MSFDFALGLVLGVVLSPWIGPPIRACAIWINKQLTKEKPTNG